MLKPTLEVRPPKDFLNKLFCRWCRKAREGFPDYFFFGDQTMPYPGRQIRDITPLPFSKIEVSITRITSTCMSNKILEASQTRVSCGRIHQVFILGIGPREFWLTLHYAQPRYVSDTCLVTEQGPFAYSPITKILFLHKYKCWSDEDGPYHCYVEFGFGDFNYSIQIDTEFIGDE